MFTESRKIQLLEDVIKTSDEETLAEIEAVLKRSRKKVAAKKINLLYMTLLAS